MLKLDLNVEMIKELGLVIVKVKMFKYNEIKLTAKFRYRYFPSACSEK